MTTLIEVRGGDGELLGRRDARCYNAERPECECVCGGMNHGAGLSRAVDNTRAYAEAMIGEYVSRHGLQDYTAEVSPTVRQLALPL